MRTAPLPSHRLGAVVDVGVEDDQVVMQFDHLAKVGIQDIEVLSVWARGTDAGLDWIQKLAEARSIRIRSCHAHFGPLAEGGPECDISEPEEGPRLAAIRAIEEDIHATARLGADIVVVHGSGSTDEGRLPQRGQMLEQSLRHLLSVAASCGVAVALENLPPGYFGGEIDRLIEIVRRLDAPNLGICFDTGHAHLNRAVVQEMTAARDFIITFHLHDNRGEIDEHKLPLNGTVPWDEFGRVLGTGGFPRPLIIESAELYHQFADASTDAFTQWKQRFLDLMADRGSPGFFSELKEH